MATLPNGSVDLVVADLPYGTTQNPWDSVIPLNLLWDAYLRVCKPAAAIVLTASQPFTATLVTSQPTIFRHEWIWVKNAGSNFANTEHEPMKEHESVLVFSRGGWTYNPQTQPRSGGGLARVGYVTNFQTNSQNYGKFKGVTGVQRTIDRTPSSCQKFNRERGLHPTQKPVALIEYMVRTYSNAGDTVLDNCMGSGTTGLACLNTDRRFIGIEMDAIYFATAKDRLKPGLLAVS